MPTPVPSRVPALDWLRAAAILLVLGRHMPRIFDALPRTGTTLPGVGALSESLALWARAGWVGVDLFFVLSGFLISGLLFREYQNRGYIDLPRFLIRRALKIYPAFYCFIAATLLVALFTRQAIPFRNIVAEAIFLQNYHGGLWPHTWSLAVEEHFYILMPLAIWWLARRAKNGGRGHWFTLNLKRAMAALSPACTCEATASPGRSIQTQPPGPDALRLVPIICLTIALAALAMRIATTAAIPYALATHLYPTHLRIDSLAFGVTLSYFQHFRPRIIQPWVTGRRRALTLLLAAAMVSPCLFLPVSSPFMHTIGLTMLYLGFGALLLAMLDCPAPAWRPARMAAAALALIGVNSYSIYLWHMAVRDWGLISAALLTGSPLLPAAALALYFLGSIAVGILMARLVESRVLAFRDRLFASRTGPAETPEPEPSSAPPSPALPHAGCPNPA